MNPIDKRPDLFQHWKSYKGVIVSQPLGEEEASDLVRTIKSLFNTALNPIGCYESQEGFFVTILHNKITPKIKALFPSLEEIEPFYYPALEYPPLSPEGILLRNRRILNLSAEELENKLKNEFDDAQKHLNENHQPLWDTVYDERYRECNVGYGTDDYSNIFPLLNAGVSSTQGDYRDSMEDAHLIDVIKINIQGQEKQIPIFGIFDGHSGAKCAHFMAAHLCAYLENKFRTKIEADSKISDLDIFNILKLTFVELGAAFHQSNKSRDGSTAIIALMIDQDMWVANVGDSRAILSTEDEVIALSEDAKLSLTKYLKGVWKRGQTVFKSIFNDDERINGSLAMARSVGHDEITSGVNPRPKIVKYSFKDLSKDAYLTLACDGLWDVASSTQVAKTLHEHAKDNKTCTQIAFELTKRAFSTGSDDNISVLVVKMPPLPSTSNNLFIHI